MIKNIVFDLNGVFLGFDVKKHVRESGLSPLDLMVFFRAGQSPIWKDYDLGKYKYRIEMYDALLKEMPNEGKRLKKVLTYTNDQYGRLNHKLVSFVESLKPDYSIYMLSNLGYEEMETIRKMEFMTLFDGAMFSCEKGVMKPDLAFYQCLLDEYHLDPKECIFVDDLKKNVDAAEQLGMIGVQQININHTIKKIDKILNQ